MTLEQRIARFSKRPFPDTRRADEICNYERGYSQGYADAMAEVIQSVMRAQNTTNHGEIDG